MQGDWKLADDSLFFFPGVLEGAISDLQVSPRVSVKGDRFVLGRKGEKEVEFELGELGERPLIGFKVTEHKTIVGVYRIEKDRLELCIVSPGVPNECARTRMGVYCHFERVVK
jgi:hypothetical protein